MGLVAGDLNAGCKVIFVTLFGGISSAFPMSLNGDIFRENLPETKDDFRPMIGLMTPALANSPDFTRPLELMRASHARIRRQCETLMQLVANIKKQGCDRMARETSAAVVEKLDVATVQHKEDEEQDLLPRMVASATKSRGSSLTNMVAEITTEHRVLHRAWIELRAELQEFAAGDRNSLNGLAVDRFVKLYRTHILMEEAAVYPLAEMLLSTEDLVAIGAHMAHRRGVTSS